MLTILKIMLHYFKILVYSCLATGRDTESLLVEASPFSHVVLPTGRSFLATVLFLRSSLPVGLVPGHVLRNVFLYILFLAVFFDQFWVVYINTITYRFLHAFLHFYFCQYNKYFFSTIYNFVWYFDYDKQKIYN